MTKYSYEINPRPVDLGGGWRMRLLEDDVEVGGGVFPAIPTEVEEAFIEAQNEAEEWLSARQAE